MEKFDIVAACKSPNKVRQYFDVKIFANFSSILMAGDLNCKTLYWNSRREDANEKSFAEIADKIGLVVIGLKNTKPRSVKGAERF
jgi:hypothetical protein